MTSQQARRTERAGPMAAALIALLTAGAARAAVEPLKTVPAAPAPAPASPKPPSSELPVAPVYAPNSGPLLLVNPVEAMTDMTARLEKRADAVAMEVEGRPITQGDVADVIRAMPISMASMGLEVLYRRALDQLLRQKLMVIAAEKAGLDKDPVAQRRQKAAAERALGEEWLGRSVEAAVTEDMVKARYQRDIAGRPGPEEVRARVMLVPTEAEARSLIAKAQSGGDFGELAKQYSKDASAVAGGDLGYVRAESLGAEVGSAIFSLSPGQMTAYPVQTQVGFFIVRVEGRRQRATLSLDEARGALLRDLRREAVVPVIQKQLAVTRVRETTPGQPAREPSPKPPVR